MYILLSFALALSSFLISSPFAFAQNYSLSAASPFDTNTKVISIQDMQYTPASLTIDPGTKIAWINQDNTAHTITSDSKDGGQSWDSGNIDQNKFYARTFNTPGTYTYHCTIHPNMKGTIVVRGTQNAMPPQNQQPQNTQPPSTYYQVPQTPNTMTYPMTYTYPYYYYVYYPYTYTYYYPTTTTYTSPYYYYMYYPVSYPSYSSGSYGGTMNCGCSQPNSGQNQGYTQPQQGQQPQNTPSMNYY